MKKQLILPIILGGLALSAGADQVPMEHFFKDTQFGAVSMSPDGQYIAATVRTKQAPDARNLVVLEIDTLTANVITGYDDEDIQWVTWADNDRLVFNIFTGQDDPDAVPIYQGTYSIEKDGENGRMVHQYDRRVSRRMLKGKRTGERLQILHDLPNDPEHCLVGVFEDRYMFPDAYTMNIKSGKLRKLEDNRSNVVSWHADNAGDVRLAIDMGQSIGDRIDYLMLKQADGGWRELIEFESEDLEVLGFSADNGSAFIASRHDRDKFALFQMDLDAGELGSPIVEDPDYDVYGFGSGRLVQSDDGDAYYYVYQTDKPRQVFFDTAWQNRMASLNAALPRYLQHDH